MRWGHNEEGIYLLHGSVVQVTRNRFLDNVTGGERSVCRVSLSLLLISNPLIQMSVRNLKMLVRLSISSEFSYMFGTTLNTAGLHSCNCLFHGHTSEVRIR